MSTSFDKILLGKEAIALGVKAGNVNISSKTNVEVLDLNEASRQVQQQHASVVRKFELQKRARGIVVPTSIDEVKRRLRELGQPITLFGEDPATRRERLKEVIAGLQLDDEALAKLQHVMNQGISVGQSTNNLPKQKEIQYSMASEALITARKQISEYSFRKAQTRINSTRATRENDELQRIEDNKTIELYNFTKDLSLNSSQVADERPLSCVRYSYCNRYIATGSLSSSVKVWDVSSQQLVSLGLGHEERITSLSWDHDSKGIIASASADKTCKIWAVNNSDSSMNIEGNQEENTITPLQTLTGHTSILTACEFHPLTKYVGTSSHDYTWRLWDVEVGSELLLQDGHNRECTALCFQYDGSLAVTGDINGIVLVWDIRSGQCIQPFQGHIKKVVNANFSSNGFQFATCSVDNQVRIWDLRNKKCSYILPAHSNAITDVRYSKSGETLITSSFDGSIKVFGTRDYRILSTLTGHLGKVMSCDYSIDERHIVSAGFDRTFKIWAHKNEF